MIADEAEISGGFVTVGAGAWLLGSGQPALSDCSFGSVIGLRHWFLSPDRSRLSTARYDCGKMICSSSSRPFVTRLDPTESLSVVTEKLLVAPAYRRSRGRLLRLSAMSFSRAICLTEFRLSWAVVATRSRVMRHVVADGETCTVSAQSVVAWSGRRPSVSCGRITALDLLLPRRPKSVSLVFHGHCVVWIEGC